MKKIFLQKWLLPFSAIAFISGGLLWACAGGDWDEYYDNSVFTPEAFVDSVYFPFIASNERFYAIGYDTEHRTRFNDEVLQDWENYLGTQDTLVRYFLFTASVGRVDSICRPEGKKSGVPLSSIPLLQQKGKQKKAEKFFQWLYYARHNEAYAAPEIDYWSYDRVDTVKRATDAQVLRSRELEKAFLTEDDTFVKQRYFFQLVRDRFFFGQYPAAIAYYRKYYDQFPENVLSARTLAYVAGCYYRQAQYDTANYLYSRVYNMNDRLKVVSEYSFHPQEEKDWRSSLALCRNKEEKISLWQLTGIYFDEQRAIEAIYALDPASDKLNLLLSRLVNIQEQKSGWMYSQSSEKMFNPVLNENSRYNITMLDRIAAEEKTASPYMWHMAAGYLHFMAHHFDIAAKCYERAAKRVPAGGLATDQLRMLKIMNRVASVSVIRPDWEQQLLPDLDWLQSYQGDPALRSAAANAWVRQCLAMKYGAQRDWLRSELFVHRDPLFAQAARINTLKAFLSAPDQTPFEQFCVRHYPISVADISEYQAIVLVYADKIKEAIPYISDVATDTLPGNPFNGKIKDCHDCDHAAPQKVKYTKLSFLQKLSVMQDLLANKEDVYNNALLLGNAFYNISHYGNARRFYECNIIGSSHYSPVAISDVFCPMLIDQQLPEKYYKIALSAAENDEQRAKVTYLLLKCERNKAYQHLYSDSNYTASWDFANIPVIPYAGLKTYKHTKYYKEIIAECGYFRTYLAKHP